MLAGGIYRRTGDRDFVKSIWSNVQRALEWIDRYGDADGDGFVEYSRRSKHGLIHQGWKDSHDSVFHSDGALADGAHRVARSTGPRVRRQLAGERLGYAIPAMAQPRKS